ncbi:MAG: hypothetical protein PQJ58_10450 [Spirochaetales bacterium]|nr:hypothetical protein [Spirochaetales bacterium]
MNYYHLILLIFVCLVIVVLLRKRNSSAESDAAGEKDEMADLNEVFLSHAGDREIVDLVKVFNPSDLMILRSMLAAEAIDSYVKSNYFGELLGSAKESIFSTSVISVFKDSTEDAVSVVENYISNLIKNKSSEEQKAILEKRDHVSLNESVGLPAADLKYIPELLVPDTGK